MYMYYKSVLVCVYHRSPVTCHKLRRNVNRPNRREPEPAEPNRHEPEPAEHGRRAGDGLSGDGSSDFDQFESAVDSKKYYF